jgi:DNA modification methylase
MSDYQSFLQTKEHRVIPTGIADPVTLGDHLFPYQADIVRWALKRGRAAIFSACGTGKTAMQLEWARHVAAHTGGNVLILAPLAVNLQTVAEGERFGIVVHHARCQADVRPGVTITNYEMLHRFEPEAFAGIVLDESSIIKAYDGKTTDLILSIFRDTPFKLACTATPSPNDFMELGNHSEFLGVMSRVEMLATFFVHDGGDTSKWRLKGHAAKEFWRWICRWAVMVQKPSDLGYSDAGFVLPPLAVHDVVVESAAAEGALFAFEAQTLQERQQARKASIDARVAACAEIANAAEGQYLIWCNLNEEADKVTKAVPGAVNVQGSDSPEFKERQMMAFARGELRVLVSKSSICGFGMNFQSCHQMAFLGLSDSFEQYYQAVRRCWRFGQTQPVTVHIITSEAEGAVVKNIQEKERRAEHMSEQIIEHMRDEMNREIHGVTKDTDDYREDVYRSERCTIYLGDCVEKVNALPDASVHYSIFSPPFASLYTYSNSPRDMGNCRDYGTFADHFGFLVTELFRVLKPGRLLSFHCMNLPTSKQHHGYIGIQDFRGDLIRMFQAAGFIFHSEVVIWKDPVTAMQRTKALGLLHKQIKKDSCMSRQGIPDYLVTMRKPGDNPEPVSHTNEDFPVDLWQRYASPVWMDINPSDTLQYRSAREHEDERHICPIQLQVVRRALKLWSNPDDLVLSPFAGIGSELVVALEEGRRAVGVELKGSYYRQAVANCRRAEHEQSEQLPLFAGLDLEVAV